MLQRLAPAALRRPGNAAIAAGTKTHHVLFLRASGVSPGCLVPDSILVKTEGLVVHRSLAAAGEAAMPLFPYLH
jgi:hypothetical protein